MRRAATALSAAAILFAVQEGPYEKRADMPQSVYGHGGAVVGGRYHALGGCATPDWTKAGRHHQVYDPAPDAWIRAADLPVELGWPMPAVHKGKIYLFGGQREGARATDLAHVYDPAADTWSPIRRLPKTITNGFAASFGDHIYVGLGYNRQGPKYGKRGGGDVPEQYVETYRYDPASDAYTRVADAPEHGIYCAAGAWGDSIYVVPGVEVESGFKDMEDYVWSDGALKYTPSKDRWTKIASPRGCKRVFYLTQNSSCVSHGEQLFIVGGMAEGRGRTTIAEYFDMAAEIFRPMPPLPVQRCCGGGGVVGDLLVLTGGFYGPANTGNPCRPTWVYRCK